MKIVIMMGASGSGKTTYVKNLIEGTHDWSAKKLLGGNFPHVFGGNNSIVLSADQLAFNDEGTWVKEMAKTSHKICLRFFLKIIQMQEDYQPGLLIVDNTNTRLWEIAPYVAMAIAWAFKSVTEVVLVDRDEETCIKQCSHPTPPGTIKRHIEQIKKTLEDWPSLYWPEIKRV